MDELTKLREELDAAERSYLCVAQTNVWGKTAAERIEIDKRFEEVKARFFDVYGRYRDALDGRG